MGIKTAWLSAAAAGIVIWGAGGGTSRSAKAAESSPAAPAAGLARAAVMPYKTLTWDDFRVDDSVPGMAAETGTALGYRVQMHADQSDKDTAYTVSVSGITFSGGFDYAHSWRRSKTISHPDALCLLRHEQGHLDIAESGRRRLEALPLSALPVGHGSTLNEAVEDLRGRMADWFRAEAAQIKTRQLQYDAETSNALNKNVQQKWNDLLTRELIQAPLTSTPLLAAIPQPSPAPIHAP